MRGSRAAILVLMVFLVVCLTLVLAGPVLAAGGARDVTVDAGKVTGAIRSLQGAHWDPGVAGSTLNDIYLSLGVDAVRTHDAGGIDSNGVGDIDGYKAIDAIFPDFSKDPNAASSYNFAPTDQLIKNIRSIGARVYFRVGRTNRAGIDFANQVWFNSYVPDTDKFAEVVRHVVMHYNKGWAGGYHFNIQYWEIWNEPDFQPFWRGTAAQYYELYKKCATAILSADSTVKIGGPANTTHNDAAGMQESFLKFVKDNNLPLDFYSYHHYANKSVNPRDNARWATFYRTLLDSYGFTKAEIVNSEYGTALDGTKLIGGAVAEAVFTAEAQMYMQDSPVDQVYSYMMIPLKPSQHSPEVAPTKENKAFGMVSTLNRTAERLWASGGDDTGFAVLAGRSAAKHELRVLIANYEVSAQNMGPIPGGNDETLFTGPIIIPPIGVNIPAPGIALGKMTYLDRLTFTYQNTEGYNLAIKNIPLDWGSLTVKQYRIDSANDMKLVKTTLINSNDRLNRFLTKPVTVSGSWVHAAAEPPLDPVGVAQGVDLIVVTGNGR
jgi:xylan 1,4-beta-xylosidase